MFNLLDRSLASRLTPYRHRIMSTFTSLEICAGAGGQALGLEEAGFAHKAVVEIEKVACETLTANRKQWRVLNEDVRSLKAGDVGYVDLLAGGVPCPPFSVASRQLGQEDERDLFPAALKLVKELEPRAVILENVPGLAGPRFADYRRAIRTKLARLEYRVFWKVLNASDFGVPQLRPRFILVALKSPDADYFSWPEGDSSRTTVGEALRSQMEENGWTGAERWALRANKIAPTIVGGSKLHGGPDLGPTRAKRAWRDLGVDGMGIANAAPDESFPIDADPKLTVRMAATLQGFPETWEFVGRKTAAYRQVGNAFPPPFAQAIGIAVRDALTHKKLGTTGDTLAFAHAG